MPARALARLSSFNLNPNPYFDPSLLPLSLTLTPTLTLTTNPSH